MKILIIVPAFNEAPIIASSLRDIKSQTRALKNKTILVVDDGSSDDTYIQAQKQKVQVVRHILNRGLGGALGTGLAFARRHCFDLAITIDADGQHSPKEIHKLIKPILTSQAEVVIGTRFSRANRIPIDRQILLRLSNILTQLLFGIYTTDSQSGFRAFSKKAINLIKIKTDRMEVSSELFSEIRRLRLNYCEVPIKVLYTPYSRAKGQSNSNALNVAYKLFLRLFR